MSTTKTIQVSEIKARNCVRAGRVYEGEVLRGHQAEIVPGKSIRLFGLNYNHVNGPQPFDCTFKIGDEAAYDSYNLVYTGKIVSITAKGVTIRDENDGKNYRLDLHTFSYRNFKFDAAQTRERNLDTLSAI